MARLSLESLDRVQSWLAQSDGVRERDRQVLIELVESIGDDSWRLGPRWYVLYDEAADLYDCQPREGLHLLMREELDHQGEWVVQILAVYAD